MRKDHMTKVMKHDFGASQKIEKQNCFSFFCCFCKKNKRSKYRSLVWKSNSRIMKEMDLQKFLQR